MNLSTFCEPKVVLKNRIFAHMYWDQIDWGPVQIRTNVTQNAETENGEISKQRNDEQWNKT